MELDKIFASHMVFAAHKPIRVYGTGEGRVEVNFVGQTLTHIATSGKWSVEFPPMEYGGPYSMQVTFRDKIIVMDDIYIGEVILFAGQSNIEFKMKESSCESNLYKSNDMLRLFSAEMVNKTDYFTPKDGWVVCEKDVIENWSALAYLVGNKLSNTKNIAVGCIACYQGASVIESWVPKGSFNEFKIIGKHPDHTNEEYTKWNGEGFLYEYAISQIFPFSLSSVVWYQGESDTSTSEGKVYAEELCELINVWRNDFQDDFLPFIVVQIADYIVRNDKGWKLVQDAQERAQSMLSYVKTVVSKDVCENDNIHPKTKAILATRIAEAVQDVLIMYSPKSI